MTIIPKPTFGKDLPGIFDEIKITFDEKDKPLNAQLVLINQLVAGKYQPREEFDVHALKELADSIERNGILQPIVVRSTGAQFEIIAGERRWRAAQMARLTEVPIIICDINDESALAFSLIENIQRENLNSIEEAKAFARLIDEFKMSHEQIAKAVGRSRSMITNTLRLLNLTDAVKNLLILKQLDVGHAKVLLALGKENQELVAKTIIEKKFTVRETENLVRKLLEKELDLPIIKTGDPVDAYIDELEEKIITLIKTKAKLKIINKDNIKLMLSFSSLSNLDEFIARLNS